MVVTRRSETRLRHEARHLCLNPRESARARHRPEEQALARRHPDVRRHAPRAHLGRGPRVEVTIAGEPNMGGTSGPITARGPAYHEPQKSIVRCLEYGTRCPQLAESQAAAPERDSRIKSPRRPPPRPRHQPPRVHGRARAGALFRSPRAGVQSDADLRAQLLLVRRRTARPVRISSLCGRAEAPVRPFDRSQINSYPVLLFFFPSLVRVRRFRAISAL